MINDRWLYWMFYRLSNMLLFIVELIAAVWDYFSSNICLFINVSLANRTSNLTFHACSKSVNAFFIAPIEFYNAEYYKGPPPKNEIVTRINFTSLVIIFKFPLKCLANVCCMIMQGEIITWIINGFIV